MELDDSYSVYDDTRALLADACMMYLLSELRDVAKHKEEKLPLDILDGDEEAKKALLQMPLQTSTVEKIILGHAEDFNKCHGDRRHETHLKFLTSYHRETSDEEEGTLPDGEIVLFDDERSDTELVYAIRLDHVRKRVVVAFRGSITAQDFLADANALPVQVINPVVGQADYRSADVKLKKHVKPIITVHKGFLDYLFNEDFNREGTPEEKDEHPNNESTRPKEEGKAKYTLIIENLRPLMDQYPDYSIWVTGHSLGGALCTLFSFYAACELPKPVTCVSFASPKIGNLSFRAAVQYLEDTGKLRMLRVANQNDPVTLVPKDPLMVLVCNLIFALFFLAGLQSRIFRHVGLGLILYDNSQCLFIHARNDPNYCRTLFSDLAKVTARIFVVLVNIVICIVTLGTCAKWHRLNHGYPEYWNRVQENAPRLKKYSLSGLYDSFAKGDRSVVKCRYW